MLDNNTSKIYRCIFAKRESRYAVARAICYGQKDDTRKRYTDSQEEQLGALGLVTNAVVLWMTLDPLFFAALNVSCSFRKIRVTPWSRSRVVTAHISDTFRQRRSME
ncbi:hypothetical protein AAB26_24550 [Salmonella enterica subsp. houtenae]|nr:hypothetical protein [Salmonella enterica subsp. houtenae]EDW3820362.1 transposase [Salmonella enterica subsp. houtenae]